jgi:NAD(P)-dependent dehydrogenase (short-subunit alcohol dehydrogenase family)
MDTVLITGCSSGIGRATAARMARRGWTVYATARKPDTMADLARQGCRLLALDVTDEASMTAAVAEAESGAGGALDALVNNAGYGEYGAVEAVALDLARQEFETNVFGLARMVQLVLPGMRRQRRGRIVNVSSTGGRLTFPGGGWYHASKYAVEALSDALRFEVQPFGVDVVLIEPGTIKTRFGETVIGSVPASDGGEAGPYDEFHQSVAQTVHNAYDGMLGRFAVGPDAVARVIERALTVRRPRPRYPVTAGARLILATRRLLPDRAFDAVLRTQFTPPRP